MSQWLAKGKQMSNQQQNQIKVKLNDIVDALEFSGMSSMSEIVTYLDTSTGKIIVDMDESEFGFEAEEELPDDLFENDRYCNCRINIS